MGGAEFWGKAPSLDDLQTIAANAFRSLPEEFRSLCGDVPLVVQDFPDDDVVLEMELDSPFEILGLFQGPTLAERDVITIPYQTMIFLYRRPILDYWAENDETLPTVIRHVLIHEIGHHFGLSDADMDRIERA
ncbi:putative Zn-dependent protease with MMP-like domain [Rhizomicrobium palustre]|uniref:Putative Zn-dependent protease with MMP-like domain n=1 Tax=Rhizomicrobium palustre TaxID=189966 RepID=A0A846N5I1_9PROT|nr:metallopeptidase family protein [Rhizomicrobium palustre]NIK90441.1 putative Zn-dependent protease with MMP-like domain [Rhizomicrobium palustre]